MRGFRSRNASNPSFPACRSFGWRVSISVSEYEPPSHSRTGLRLDHILIKSVFQLLSIYLAFTVHENVIIFIVLCLRRKRTCNEILHSCIMNHTFLPLRKASFPWLLLGDFAPDPLMMMPIFCMGNHCDGNLHHCCLWPHFHARLWLHHRLKLRQAPLSAQLYKSMISLQSNFFSTTLSQRNLIRNISIRQFNTTIAIRSRCLIQEHTSPPVRFCVHSAFKMLTFY